MPRPRAVIPKVNVIKRDGVWSCWWNFEGKVVRRGCDGATSEKAARAVAERRFNEWRNPPPPAAYTVGQLIDAYIADRTTKPRSESFLVNFKHVRPFFAGYTASMLTADAWTAYRKHRTAMQVGNASSKFRKVPKLVSDATAVRELNALRGAIGWGRERQWVGLDKVEMVLRDQITNPRHEFLTRPEFSRLIAALDTTPHLALFCRLAVATGARMGALLSLTWANVSWPGLAYRGGTPFDDGELTPAAVKVLMSDKPLDGLVTAFEIDMGQGVRNKKRPSGLISRTNVGLWNALVGAWLARQQRMADGKAICDALISFHGKPIKSVDLSDAFERANIPQAKRTAHVLKHTCCSWLVERGLKYAEIARLVGTSAETIERHYGHLHPEHLDRVADALSVA